MAGLEAGALDREITLLLGTPRAGTSESGEVILDYNAVTDDVNAGGFVDAQWFPAGTRESDRAADRLAAYVDGVYRIQYRTVLPSPDTARIIGHDGRLYDCKPYIEGGRQEWIDLPVVATDALGDSV